MPPSRVLLVRPEAPSAFYSDLKARSEALRGGGQNARALRALPEGTHLRGSETPLHTAAKGALNPPAVPLPVRGANAPAALRRLRRLVCAARKRSLPAKALLYHKTLPGERKHVNIIAELRESHYIAPLLPDRL